MKYKVLLNAITTAFTKDFMRYTEEFFETISTSIYFKDVTAHFKLFSPDVYICFVDSSHTEALEQINNLRHHDSYNGAPIVTIVNADVYKTMDTQYTFMPDLVLQRPISPDNIALRVTRFMEEREAKEAEEKARKEKKLQEAREAVEAYKRQEEEVQKAAEIAAKKQILIVDDDRTVLKMLKAALEDTYDVTAMANGVLVEKILASKKMDLIILDYEMPLENGAEIFRKLRANEKTNDIPICFLTGVAERNKILEIMMLKPNAYLLKPIDMDMLKATISNLIS